MPALENDLEDDENFDKPDPKSKLEDKKKKDDDFEEDEPDEEDELADLDVEIEGEGKSTQKDDKSGQGRDDQFKSRSEEGRFGKRRGKFKRHDSRLVRDLESKLNAERSRGDKLEERLTAVESNTSRITDSNVDAQIIEATRYLNQAKAAHAQAVKDGDGDAAAEALDVMLEAKETVGMLKATKKDGRSTETSTETRKTEGGKTDNGGNIPKPDPAVLRMFDQWHEDNEWYDPGLRDKHSRIAYYIDNALNAEGYNPKTPEYWKEFDKRCRANPTLSSEVFNNEDQDEEDEEMEEERPKKRQDNERKRPAPQNDRSSANGGGRKKITVSRERADAMRQMGLQPGTAEWKRMAKKYESYDKQRKA